MESIAINIKEVTYKKEERSFLSSLRNRLSSKIVLPITINTDNTRCKDFDFNNVNCLLSNKKKSILIHPEDKHTDINLYNSDEYCDMV